MSDENVTLNVKSTGTGELADALNNDAAATKQLDDATRKLNETYGQTPDNAQKQAQAEEVALQSLIQQKNAAIQTTQAYTSAEEQQAAELQKLVGVLGSVEDGYQALDGVIDGIKGSEMSIQEQIGALQEMKAVLFESIPAFQQLGSEGQAAAEILRDKILLVDTELHNLDSQSIAAGQQLQESARESEAALQQLDSAAAETATGIRNIGDAGRTGLQGFDSIIENAEAAAVRFNTRLQEDSRISRQDLRTMVIAAEEFRSKIIETYGSIESATPAVISSYKAIESELENATQKANTYVNAVRDHSIQLQETGNRIAGIGNAVQGFTNIMGPAGQAVGQVAGQVGILAANFEQAKDVLAGLHLNTLSFGGSALTLTTQIGLVVGAIYASVTAGQKLSEVIGTDKQAFDDFASNVTSKSSSIGSDFKGWTSSVQSELDKVIASLINLQEDLASLDPSRAKSALKDLSETVLGLGIAWSSGKKNADAFHASLNIGLPIIERLKLSMSDASQVSDFFTEAQAKGEKGMKLWAEATELAHGKADGLKEAVKNLKPELDALKDAHEKLSEAAQKDADAHLKVADAVKKASDAAETAKNKLEDESDAIVDNVKHLLDYNTVEGGSTKALNDKIKAIDEYLPKSQEHSVALKRLAGELQEVLDKTDGLTAAQRAQIQSVIDAAKNANDLTAAQKQAAEQTSLYIVKSSEATKAQETVNTTWENGVPLISNVKTATEGLTVTYENGVPKISNVKTAQEGVNAVMKDGKIVIENAKAVHTEYGDVVAKTDEKLKNSVDVLGKLKAQHVDTNPKINEAADYIKSLGEGLGISNSNAETLITTLATLKTAMGEVTIAAKDMKAAVAEASTAGLDSGAVAGGGA